MTSDALSLQALNRALLDRQMLLRRAPLPGGAQAGEDGRPAEDGHPRRAVRVIETVEQLAGLQAQAPFPPYYGLWSRLEGFRPGDLAELILSRQVVRIALMRGTIHLVSARDCLMMRPLIQPVIDRGFASNFGRQLTGVDAGALAAAGWALVEEKPRTFSELGALLAQRWPGQPPAALAQAIRTLVPLVQVPPRAIWGAAGQAAHTSAESWLGAPLHASPSPDQLVRRYLAAFGPATVRDMQAWSGLTGLREVAERLRPSLRIFQNGIVGELFDLPDAPLPDPETPAPVRLVAEFDNLVLAHADRTRIISEQSRKRLYRINGVFPGTVLVGGFAAGMWKIARSAAAARSPAGVVTLSIEVFGHVSAADRDAISAEGERMLEFAAPDARMRDIRFAPIT